MNKKKYRANRERIIRLQGGEMKMSEIKYEK